jgi:hypothetical protein
MELGGSAAYHPKAVPIRDKENKRIGKASPLINSHRCARKWPICLCVLLPFSPENLENSGILDLVDMGQCKACDHMDFDMSALLWLH